MRIFPRWVIGTGLVVVVWTASCDRFPLSGDPVQHDALISLSVSPAKDTADGARIDTLIATMDPTSTPAGSAVQFATTLGALIAPGAGPADSVTVHVDASNVARAYLVAPADAGIAHVTATAAGITRADSLTYVSAPATAVQLIPDEPGLQSGAGHSVGVTALLVRPTGAPSPGYTLHFAAMDSSKTHKLGQFNVDVVTAASSSVTVRFTAGDTNYVAPAYLTVTATRGALPPLVATATLLIGKP
jgi:hypothetical protein